MALVLMIVTWVSPVGAEPTRDRILADIQIEESAECAVINVGFNFPIRYQRHFPAGGGNELRIGLLPISISPDDLKALFERESVRPPESDVAALSEVIYEGDMAGGPFLTLLFRHPVLYEVGQGTDYRSIRVAVRLPEATAPCKALKKGN